jgi:hypothetical protein
LSLALFLDSISQHLEDATAIAWLGVLLDWRTKEAAAFGQAVSLAQVVGAYVLELFVDQRFDW